MTLINLVDQNYLRQSESRALLTLKRHSKLPLMVSVQTKDKSMTCSLRVLITTTNTRQACLAQKSDLLQGGRVCVHVMTTSLYGFSVVALPAVANHIY